MNRVFRFFRRILLRLEYEKAKAIVARERHGQRGAFLYFEYGETKPIPAAPRAPEKWN